MARTILLQDRWDQGVKQDFPRDQMPAGSVWYATDMLPNIAAKLRERGGYSNSASNIASSLSTASRIEGGIYAPFVAGAKNLPIDEDGQMFSIAAGSVSSLSAVGIVKQNPVFHRDKVIVFAAGGASNPKVYDGTTISTLGGSPPTAIYATVFTDRTVAGNTLAQPQRLYFSAAGNPASWDTTNSYIDFTDPITGLASLRTAILVFSLGNVSRIRGYTPPTVAGGSGDFADGAGQDDLTRRCGMKRYWQDTIMAGYTGKTGSIAGGVIKDYYIVTVINATNTFQGGAIIDLRGPAWWPITNFDFTSMWSMQGATDELYAGRRGAARVASLSSIFIPAIGVKNDRDADPF